LLFLADGVAGTCEVEALALKNVGQGMVALQLDEVHSRQVT
jgi:hypothetical protein